MPCNSGYQDPTREEINKVETSSLLIYVNKKLGIETPNNIKKAAKHTHGVGVDLDIITRKLCSTLKKLNKKQINEIVYNAKDKNSRLLANWWEEHQEADKKRLTEEAAEKEEEKIRKKAIAKLSLKERKILGLT